MEKRNSASVATGRIVVLGFLVCLVLGLRAVVVRRSVRACPPPQPCTISVNWEGVSEGCPKNGGYRVWVGKTSPSDPSNHDEYTVKAVTQPGHKVYFRAWDPDDPSSATYPVDPNDDPQRGKFVGQDNRRRPHPYVEGQWTSGEPGNETIERTADGSGAARATLRVTPRPGDNFMVTASCDTDKVSTIAQEEFDRREFPPGVAVSSMLTVWRKVHINFSSLPDDTSGRNEAEGGVWAAIDDVDFEGHWNATRLEVDDFSWEDEEDDHFYNGVIRIGRKPRHHECYNHRVIETRAYTGDEYVYIEGDLTKRYNSSDWDYRLVDDDNCDNAMLSLQVVYPRKPDTSELDAALADCYMAHQPYVFTVRNDFIKNARDSALANYITDPGHYPLHSAISDYFFTLHVVSLHQSEPRRSGDGDKGDLDPAMGEESHYKEKNQGDEPKPEGAILGFALLSEDGLCLFLEPIREHLTQQPHGERAVLLHEVGHCLGAGHHEGANTVMAPDIRSITRVEFADKAKDEIRSKVWRSGEGDDWVGVPKD